MYSVNYERDGKWIMFKSNTNKIIAWKLQSSKTIFKELFVAKNVYVIASIINEMRNNSQSYDEK